MSALPVEVKTVPFPHDATANRYLLMQFRESAADENVNIEITTEGISPQQGDLVQLLKVVLAQLESMPTTTS